MDAARSAFLTRSRAGLAASSSSGGFSLEAFDGLDDLEEELDEEDDEYESDDEEWEEDEEIDESKLGEGLLKLEQMMEKFRKDFIDPDLDDDELAELHEQLMLDAPRCPDVAAVARTVRSVEEMGIEDDELLEVLGDVLVERADELQPQGCLDAIRSFGNCYWVGDELVDALAGAVRRQLKDFTQGEVVSICNGLMRMGATDDSRHAGLFYEMRQRVNLPMADKFIREALNRDGMNYGESEESREAIAMLDMPKNSKLREKASKQLAWELQTSEKRLAEESSLEPEWDSVGDDIRGAFGQLPEGAPKEEEGRP